MHDLTIALKMARMRLGITQPDMSKILNYNPQNYSQIETKIDRFVKMPTYKFLKLCFCLDERFRDEVLTKEFLKKLLTDYENNEYNA